MYIPRASLIQRCKQAFFGYRTEQLLCTTFWPNDYKRGHEYTIDGQKFHITRYTRAADTRFFEVWGYEVQPAAQLVPGAALAR